MKQLPLAMQLRERALFSSFVPGPNSAAVAQLLELASGARSGVCWLSGAAGCGKTHLLQASCAQAGERGIASAYLPLRQLLPLGAESLEGWDSARLLALDDLQLIAGVAAWEQAVFRLYRELEERGGVLIVAADVPPRGLQLALPDLASRLSAATVFALKALDDTQQREALRLRALARGLELPPETALYLQRRFRRDLATLYQLLDQIDAAALQAQRRLTVPFIRLVLTRRSSASE